VFYLHGVVAELLEVADVSKSIMPEEDDVALLSRIMMTGEAISVLGSEGGVEAGRDVVCRLFEGNEGRLTEIETVGVTSDKFGVA
jgi:hypothetical protein